MLLRAKTTPLIDFFRAVFSTWDYGITLPEGGRRVKHTKVKVQTRYNNDDKRLRQLANYDFENHFANNSTFYYFSNGNPHKEHALIMLDFDAKGRGTNAGCCQAEEYVRQKYFGGKWYHCEDSTHGTGRHNYITLYKLGRHANEVNDAIMKLKKAIREDLTAQGFDISGFDITGTCDWVEWTSEFEHLGPQITEYHCGLLGKIPRHADERIISQHVFTLEHLESVSTQQPKITMPLPKVGRTGTVKLKLASNYGGLTADDFDLQHKGEQLWRRLRNAEHLPLAITCKQNRKCDVDFAGVAFCILAYCFEHPKKDGSCPHAMIEYMWKQAYHEGLIEVAFCPNKWIAFRNYMSSQGYIHWIDNTYRIGNEILAGVACKWRLTDEIYTELTNTPPHPSLSLILFYSQSAPTNW